MFGCLQPTSSLPNFSSNFLQFYLFMYLFVLTNLSNFSKKMKWNEILQFLSSTSRLFFDCSPPLQLLQFLLSNLLSSTLLSNPCFPNARRNGHWKVYQFSSLICLSSCGFQFLEGLVFVCVCVFWVLFLCKLEIFNFFCVASFFSFPQLKIKNICKPGFINSTNHNPFSNPKPRSILKEPNLPCWGDVVVVS